MGNTFGQQRFDSSMPALTRKQINEQPERWQILYAGVASA